MAGGLGVGEGGCQGWPAGLGEDLFRKVWDRMAQGSRVLVLQGPGHVPAPLLEEGHGLGRGGFVGSPEMFGCLEGGDGLLGVVLLAVPGSRCHGEEERHVDHHCARGTVFTPPQGRTAVYEIAGGLARLMVYFCAYGPMRPEEQAALRRTSVTLDPLAVRITEAAPELNTGRRVEGDTKSAAGVRTIHLPAFLSMEVKRHLDWFAEKKPDGLLFIGEKGAPFRRTTFGRKWAKARAKVGLPKDFRFYDLRHTGHTLSTQSGATLKDTMVRAGQSSEKAAMIYQHSDDERQQEVAGGIDARVRAARDKAAVKRSARGA